MKNKNLIIRILTVLLVSSSTLGFASNITGSGNEIMDANTVLSDTIPSIVKKAKTNYALAKAKVALLKSQIALEIDNSKQKAEAELNNAINYLSEAKSTADKKTKAEIDLLKTKVNTAKKSVVQKKDDALDNVSTAVDEAKIMSEKYNDKFQTEKEKNIATVNRKYAELRAEESLLRAKIAAQSEKTYAQAQVYLKEANEWYIRSKEYGTKKINPYVEQLQKDIEDAQTYLKKKDKEARNKISDILQKAKEIIKED
ncbi:MAG: hypothetical protein KAT68_02205 [Bacteroidales bacterium]|nr:hypothetical protein [Bacteroidales bacterium]